MMRIAIAGISHESSTFSRHRTGYDDFTVMRGNDLWEALKFFDTVGPIVETVQWVPVLRATAVPGGPVDPQAFDSFVDEIVSGLTTDIAAHGPLDGVYLFLHGAMHVSGRADAEEALVRRVREAVGPDAVLSASMDTHGNLSLQLAGLLDLASVHRHAPHIDIPETHARAVRNLIAVIERGTRPVRAHVRIPVLLPGERTTTVVEPGHSVFGALLPAIEQHGVIDAGIWIGFAWADEERNSAAVFVAGWDEASVATCAAELARGYWDARKDFTIIGDHLGRWEDALDFAMNRPPAPLFISDSGDNVSAGSSGDITYALHATFARRDVMQSALNFLFTGIVDPNALVAAVAAGQGARLHIAVGAWLDARFGEAVAREWTVVRIIEGLLGEGTVGALLRDGPISVIVQSHRAYFITPGDAAFKGVKLKGLAWVDPTAYDVVVVKNGYLFPGQTSQAASHFMAMTPGGTDLDFDRLQFSGVSRPMFPFDRDVSADLGVTMLPPLG
jgi:microcystin degradation protein MlrC